MKKPDIDEQIAFLREPIYQLYPLREGIRNAILATLEAYKRIRQAERPEFQSFCDPECEGRCKKCHDDLLRDAIAYANRMAAERDAAQTTARVCREDVEINASRAESAESKLARVEEGFRIARRLMGKQTFNDDDVNDMRSIDELLRQVEEGK